MVMEDHSLHGYTVLVMGAAIQSTCSDSRGRVGAEFGLVPRAPHPLYETLQALTVSDDVGYNDIGCDYHRCMRCRFTVVILCACLSVATLAATYHSAGNYHSLRATHGHFARKILGVPHPPLQLG